MVKNMASSTKDVPYKFQMKIDVPLVDIPEFSKRDTKKLINKKKSGASEALESKTNEIWCGCFHKNLSRNFY
jgi:hypothetical protein